MPSVNPMTELNLGNGLTSIGEGVFSGTDLTSLVIPDSVISIGNNFYDLPLQQLTLGSGVETIGNYAFYSSNLTSVDIPDNVQTIGNYTFAYSPIRALI